MAVRLTLVHSPLVGPAAWEAVAAGVARLGHQVAVPDLTATLSQGPPYATRQVDSVARSVGQEDTVLVGHSGAGPLLAPAGDACGGAVRGCVYVDAGLPTPGRSWLQSAPPELASQVQGMAQDGWLPPWSLWWGSDALVELLPDDETRERFAADCPPLPMAMFEEALPPSPGWAGRPSAYLRLSDAYREPADQAKRLGWPVTCLHGHHLSVLTQPDLVVEALLDLIARLRR